MTEEEAKKKWCPFVRHADSGGSFNRGAWGPPNMDVINAYHHDGMYSCACMAWHFKGASKDSGYCGLAGKP